jgi:SAM-dependent methyltransferase
MSRLLFICLLLVYRSIFCQPTSEEVFTEIYQSGFWNENGFSRSGAEIRVNKGYVALLQDFMQKNHIHKVVDLGCGDWQFSRYIDWSGIEYIGYDVVKYVIERNQKNFAQPSIMFIQGDALEIELPEADLLICKDVLQHLSNEDILQLLEQLYKFKHCLITNDVNHVTLSSKNPDILRGDYRPLDLTRPPFNLEGKKLLTFRAAGFSIKQVLHVQLQQE